jgi:hypothetical protein
MAIYLFLPVLECCALRIVLPALHYIEQKYKRQNKNNFVNPGKSSETNKQFHVKSWLTY